MRHATSGGAFQARLSSNIHRRGRSPIHRRSRAERGKGLGTGTERAEIGILASIDDLCQKRVHKPEGASQVMGDTQFAANPSDRGSPTSSNPRSVALIVGLHRFFHDSEDETDCPKGG
jgi:hypothetical protein